VDAARYSRQVRVPGIGDAGQRAISASTVLIVGIGALGTHSAATLARAGVGSLWLCDRDIVDLGNLQRQVLFDEDDARAGTPKAIAAARALAAVNSAIAIEPFVAHCSLEFLEALPRRPDLVLDGTDNFATRYLINDWCRQQGIPWIYGGAIGSEGAAMVVAGDGPCLRCLWPEAPAGDVGSCETHGVLAPAVAAVTAFQTAEALKLLSGRTADVARGVFTVDVWRGQYQVLGKAARSSPDCAVCRGVHYPALAEAPPVAAVLCGRDAVQVDLGRRRHLDLDALAQRLSGVVQDLRRTEHYLAFSADGADLRVFSTGRALLFGVHDPLRARALYDRWVGAS
jgi:adenylyltransferase/sulfurtransferase